MCDTCNDCDNIVLPSIGSSVSNNNFDVDIDQDVHSSNFKLAVNGGTAPFTYKWNIQSNVRMLEIVGSDIASMVEIDANPSGETITTVSGTFLKIDLLKVIVTDANGFKAKDTFLIARNLYE